MGVAFDVQDDRATGALSVDRDMFGDMLRQGAGISTEQAHLGKSLLTTSYSMCFTVIIVVFIVFTDEKPNTHRMFKRF